MAPPRCATLHSMYFYRTVCVLIVCFDINFLFSFLPFILFDHILYNLKRIMLFNSHTGVEASILYRYDRRKGDLFVLSWARVRRVCRGSVLFSAADLRWVCAQYFVVVSYSEVLRDNSWLYVAHVCFYVCCSDGAGVCGDGCGVSGVVKGCGFHWSL